MEEEILIVEQFHATWYHCPRCGRELPVDSELAEKCFGHVVVPNGHGVRIVCPEMI